MSVCRALDGTHSKPRLMNAACTKVLVIDYDEENLILLERLLENEGFDTTTAWTGQDALKALAGETFDLVLVNEYLPDMNADELMQELRHATAVPCLVMVSSQAEVTSPCPLSLAVVGETVRKRPPARVVEAVRAHHRRRLPESAAGTGN